MALLRNRAPSLQYSGGSIVVSNGNRPVAQTAKGKKGGCGGLKRGKPIAAAAKHGGRDTGHDRLGLDVKVMVELIRVPPTD